MSPALSPPPVETAAAPPSTSPPLAAPPPHRSRRPLLIGAIIGVILVLVGVSAGAYFLLRRSAERAVTTPAGELPAAGEGDAATAPAEETVAPEASPAVPDGEAAAPIIDISGALLPKEAVNVAVTVGYRRSQTFTLTINEVARTHEEPTIGLYQPLGAEPYSVVRLLAANNSVLFESQFTISTEVIAEDFSPAATAQGLQALDESTSYLVLPVTSGSPPAKVQIVSSSGQVLAEQAIAFETVPLREPAVTTSEDLSGRAHGLLGLALRYAFGVQAAHAQTPSASPLPKLNRLNINPNGGTFVQATRSVSISMQGGLTSGAQIRYTRDGSEPTSSSTRYSGSFTINRTTTVKARAFKSGFDPSDIASATITLKLARPTINPPDGAVFTTSPQTVTITMPSGAPSGVTIRYTLDGSTPTEASTQYNGSFSISETTTVKARAFKDGFEPSEVASAYIKICVPCFFIAVVGDRDADKSSAIQGATTMANSILPWSRYSDKIMVIPVNNTADLGCRLTPLQGAGSNSVVCPYEDRIHQALSGVRWHAAIVVAPLDCNSCGYVARLGNRIVGVGRTSNDYIIAHELAHAVGKLVDEFWYQFGYSGGDPGPNCFTSQNECLAKQQQFSDMECSSGCRAVNQFRPYTLMMHTLGSRVMGTFDACLMEIEITRDLGLPAPQNCENPDLPPEPTPSPGQDPTYWGWRR